MSVIFDVNQLLTRLKNGEQSAYGELYDRFSGALFGTILQIVKRQEVAEEILQETFVKVWKNIDTYDFDKGTLYTWLLNIARNLSIDKIRSKDYKKENRTTSDVVHNISSSQKTELNVDGIGLQEQINKLKPEYRLLIEKLYYEGYSQKDVSDEFNIPLGTVKTRSRMAIQQLRELLG